MGVAFLPEIRFSPFFFCIRYLNSFLFWGTIFHLRQNSFLATLSIRGHSPLWHALECFGVPSIDLGPDFKEGTFF